MTVDIDQVALEIARQFVYDGQRKAQLQVAIIEAMKLVRDSACADAVPVACIHEWRTTGGGMGKAQRHLVCMKCGIDRSHPKPAALNEVSGNSGELGEQRGVYIGMPVGERTVARAVASLQQSLTFAQDFRAEDVRVVLAALAATGKQQGGEAHGDGLATLQQDYDNLLAAFDRQVAAAEKIAATALEQDDRIEELEEALAARQPVGQEPVVTEKMLAAADAYHDSEEYRSNNFSDSHTNAACYRAMAAVAPPAQGIDLGQLRDFLTRRRAQWKSHLPSDPSAPGTRAIRTIVPPHWTEGDTDYNNDVALYREGIAVMDEALGLIEGQCNASAAMQEHPKIVPWQIQLADALDCAWNPAIEADHNHQGPGAVLAGGLAAVAARLREQAADEVKS